MSIQTPIRYADLDPTLLPWAARHGFHVTTEHHDEEIRTVAVVDDAGDAYQIFAGPNGDGELVDVGAALCRRAGRHAFFRERRRFLFRQSVPLAQLSTALDAMLELVGVWITQAGHTRE